MEELTLWVLEDILFRHIYTHFKVKFSNCQIVVIFFCLEFGVIEWKFNQIFQTKNYINSQQLMDITYIKVYFMLKLFVPHLYLFLYASNCKKGNLARGWLLLIC